MSIGVTWNSAFEAAPATGDDPLQIAAQVRNKVLAVRERAEREHYWSPSASSSKHGLHLSGSAVAFIASSAPTTRPDGAALDADDTGRMWFDSANGHRPYVWDGSAWVSYGQETARFSMYGNLFVLTGYGPQMLFSRACTIVRVDARVQTAPTGASILIDINKNGSSSIYSGVTQLTIAAGTNAGNTTTFHATNKILAVGNYLTFDIDQVGSSVSGADLSVSVAVTLN